MKTVTADSIYLKGGSYYVTEDPSDAFRVVDGMVFVYIVPLEEGRVGRRTLIYEAQKGELVPGFCFRDMDYKTWAFCLTAAEEAAILIMKDMVTAPLKEKFAQRAGIPNFQQEGFENGLVDLYRMNLVREDGFFMRTGMERQSTKSRTDDLIISVFSKDREASEADSGNELYDSMQVLCRSEGIPIAPYEKIKKCCGKRITVEDIARISHFPCRQVVLENGWYNTDAGPIIAFTKEGNRPVACIRRGTHKYHCWAKGEKSTRINKRIAASISPKAYMVYPPLPQKSLSVWEFVHFCIKGLRAADIALIVVLTLISSVLGLILPTLNQMIYDTYIPMGDGAVIVQIGCLFASFMIGNLFFSVVRNICRFRLSSHIMLRVQHAVYHKVFSLPESFFREYDSADLSGRAMMAGNIASEFTDLAVASCVSLAGLIFYIFQMFAYSPSMAGFSLLMYGVFVLIIMLFANIRLKYQRELVSKQGKTDSVMFQFLGGISKIRISGIEDRAVYEYMKTFVSERRSSSGLNHAGYVEKAIVAMCETLFLVVLYIIAYNSPDVSTGVFVAFNASFGAATAAIGSISSNIVSCRMLVPALDRIKPILECAPEISEYRLVPGELDGSLDIEHLNFSYGEGQPHIFEDLSLHIKPGEYVGIVGGSGCGKSTLIKLLLGFEKPNSGKIYYSSQDMETLDLQELRKKMGVVLQDGKLIAGSIYDNITITSPQAKLSDVQRVVEAVGLKDDIAKMPMGLHTVLSEDSSTISGGQQQRILIARAIVNDPDILFFDEATSALDNVTQSKVCETLEKMSNTRIVIAHRLTTIMNCDRIIVLNNGGIEEQGTYEQLMNNRGFFWQLASRQII